MNTPGQQSAAATLDAIDAATDQRCACGCGQALAPDGPSAWFATEWCQRAWAQNRIDPESEQRRHVASPGCYWPLSDAEQGRDAQRWLRHVAESGEHLTATVTVADQPPRVDVDVIRRLLDLAVGAGVEIWPPGAQQVRLYTGGGVEEVGTLTPDPDGDIVMASGRYAFQPANLCPEHARQAQPPADPMLAAIEAKRNRNTGPRPRQRAPRRIDPRRSR